MEEQAHVTIVISFVLLCIFFLSKVFGIKINTLFSVPSACKENCIKSSRDYEEQALNNSSEKHCEDQIINNKNKEKKSR